MLSRVADSLFWMSRYLERAEDTARLVDVNLQLLLELENLGDENVALQWRALLRSFGDEAAYLEGGGDFTTESVTEFLTFSRENPGSMLSSVFGARENARMIRDQISSEMWEVINRLYLFLREQHAATVLARGPSAFFARIKEFSHLFRGVTDATFPRQVGYDFISAGCFLERADKTGRILDIMHHLKEARREAGVGEQGGVPEVAQWIAVLRGCTGLEAYHRVYVGDVLPRNVIDFLLKAREFPRSMLFCLNRLQLAVHAVSGCPVTHFSNEAERRCGRLIAELVYTDVDEIIRDDVHAFLERFCERLAEVAVGLGHSYMFFPIVDPSGGQEQTADS